VKYKAIFSQTTLQKIMDYIKQGNSGDCRRICGRNMIGCGSVRLRYDVKTKTVLFGLTGIAVEMWLVEF
jgi:hypothetical protein